MRIRTGLAATALFGLVACSPSRPATVGGDDSGGSSSTESSGDELPDPPTTGSTGMDGPETGYFDEGNDDDVYYDIGSQLPPPGWECPDPRPGTDVKGTGPLGEFDGNVAYLGEWWGSLQYFRLVVYDKSADLEAEVQYAWQYWDFIDQGPALVITPNFEQGQPPATSVDAIGHFVGDEEEYFMGSITVDEVIEYEDVPDFPAIMSGRFDLWPDEMSDGVSGPFVAVYCRAYDDMIIAE